eukprot:TCONS_00005039-protein
MSTLKVLFGKHWKICFGKRLLTTQIRKITQGPLYTEVESIANQQPHIQCRSRKYLAGSSSSNLPETVPIYTHSEFKGIAITDAHIDKQIQEIGASIRPSLDQIFQQNKSCILIKNLPIKEAKDFNDFVKGLDYVAMSYDTGVAFRSEVESLLYSASDEPSEYSIELHNEMVYLSKFPGKIMFCCLKQAPKGGESPIVFNRDLIKLINPEVLDKFRKKGIRYLRSTKHQKNTDYIAWQHTFSTESEKVAEEKMLRDGYQWEWRENGDVTIWYNLPAFFSHPITGEEIWLNQAVPSHCSYFKSHPMYDGKEELSPSEYHFHTCYGDGAEIEDDVIDHIRSIIWNNAMSLKLLPGDVVIMDNLYCQHSRMSFEGGERKIVVSMAEPISR